jgi:2-polyprenyl-3-methyl-5-hydroxy-6-metoxy-1,4-benzoquinol methylase
MLDNIIAKEKIGIEINDIARKSAEKLGVKSVKHISDIEDDYADIIISTSVLEHVENPLGVLRELRGKLKENGKIVFHVPNESCNTEYTRSEINNHLYTWNCLTIGNLFKAAGFFVYKVEKIQEVWPNHYFEIEKEVSRELFETICQIGGKAYDENRCIIVAYK